MHHLLPALVWIFWVSVSSAVYATPAQNLATSLTFRTISEQDRTAINYGEFLKLNDFLRATYPRVFSELDVEEVNQYSLLINWPGSDPDISPILFTAHTDVVPIEPGTEGDWEHPPFDGVISQGKIFGRGALDDKEGVISLLEAAESLLSEGFRPRRGITLAFGHDEEISGKHGAAALARRMSEKGLHFEWMVDEGGFIIADNPLLSDPQPLAMINVAEKGYLTLHLSVTGPGGHSSSPPAVSTIGRLSAALSKIESNPFPARLVGPVEAMLETIGPYAPQPNRLVLNNLWLTGGIVARQMGKDSQTNPFVRTTTALTMFNAGVKENVVPQSATAAINFRLLPGDTPESVKEYVTQLVADPDIEISAESWLHRPPVAQYPGGGFAVLQQAVTAVYPDALVAPSLLPGATDTRHYVDIADNHYRFHGVVIAAQQGGGIHGTNEYIGVESFEKSIEVARQMMRLGAQ